MLSSVQMPALPADAPRSMGTIFTVAGVLALIFPFIGGALPLAYVWNRTDLPFARRQHI